MAIYGLNSLHELNDYAVVRDLQVEIRDIKTLHIKHTNLYYVTDMVPKTILLCVRDGNTYFHLPLGSAVSYLTREETIEVVKLTYEYLKIKYT